MPFRTERQSRMLSVSECWWGSLRGGEDWTLQRYVASSSTSSLILCSGGALEQIAPLGDCLMGAKLSQLTSSHARGGVMSVRVHADAERDVSLLAKRILRLRLSRLELEGCLFEIPSRNLPLQPGTISCVLLSDAFAWKQGDVRGDVGGAWREGVKQPFILVKLGRLLPLEIWCFSFPLTTLSSPSVPCCTLTCCLFVSVDASSSPFSFISSVTFQNKEHPSLPISLPPATQSLPPTHTLHFMSH